MKIILYYILLGFVINIGFVEETYSTCPEGDSLAVKMVEDFLTDPNLKAERVETGTDGLTVNQIGIVTNSAVCQELNTEFSPFFNDYNITYFKVGNFYIVTQILKDPEDPNKVVFGLSYIYIFDENLNYIKGYSG